MSRLENLLSEYGIEWTSVAERFVNSESLYLKCLNMFVSDNNLELLNQSLGGGDLETAFRAAHTIKGMSSNMGMDGVLNAACAIVEPLRIKDTTADYASLFAKLSDEMKLINELKTKADEYGK